MTVTTEETLTDEQQEIVDLPWNAKCLAVAGAGAGKTLTLVRRLDTLVARDDLLPGEILVLSFSRAAVRELRARLARHAQAAERVRVQTFDGWATAVLSRVAPEGEWHTVPFDERIENATEAIDEGLLSEFFTEELAHVVIDEVQDLVGDRSRMVQALLDRYHASAGFTVVGDPAQCIYGFQVPLARRHQEVNAFFPWLRWRFSEELTERRLTRNFRAETQAAQAALPVGPRLQDSGLTCEDHVQIHAELRNELLRSFEFFSLDSDAAVASIEGQEGTCAILSATNGQALALSRQLHLSGVRHRLQRAADDRVLPSWIAELFAKCSSSSLSRSTFDALAHELALPEGVESEMLWRALMRLDGRGHRSGVDLNRVKRGLTAGSVPDELMSQPPSRLLVSTIHRVKGLEFDRVVVVAPEAADTDRGDQYDPAGDARALYVAMTRARRELYHLRVPRDWHLRKDTRYPATDRWYRGGTGSRKGQRYGIEILGGDVCRLAPAGDSRFSPADIQEYLSEKVRPGDAVEFRRSGDLPTGERESPRYELVHRGRVVGEASQRFRSALYSFRRTRCDAYSLRWPRCITEVHLDAVETIVGDDQAAETAGTGARGVWLAPRPTGLGRLVWDKQATQDGDA